MRSYRLGHSDPFSYVFKHQISFKIDPLAEAGNFIASLENDGPRALYVEKKLRTRGPDRRCETGEEPDVSSVEVRLWAESA